MSLDAYRHLNCASVYTKQQSIGVVLKTQHRNWKSWTIEIDWNCENETQFETIISVLCVCRDLLLSCSHNSFLANSKQYTLPIRIELLSSSTSHPSNRISPWAVHLVHGFLLRLFLLRRLRISVTMTSGQFLFQECDPKFQEHTRITVCLWV